MGLCMPHSLLSREFLEVELNKIRTAPIPTYTADISINKKDRYSVLIGLVPESQALK